MLFNSYIYFVFLFAVLTAFYFLPTRYRPWLLLIASSFYYGFRDPLNLGFLMSVTFVSFYGAKSMTRFIDSSRARIMLWLVVLFNLGLLVALKQLSSIKGGIVAPIGLSFFTLQAMSYCIDVYRKDIQPEQRLERLGLFLSFFPQIMSGPIQRAKNLLPQFNKLSTFNEGDLYVGGKRIMWGLFKKVVVADKLGLIVTQVFGNPSDHSGWALLASTYLYTIQIYADFSGYTDIAIGSGRILGIRLSENFQDPYLASSIREFWKKWHISLTSWFRDYVYFPLGGNRVGNLRWIFNIATVFILSGLWHGSGANYITWGILHAFFYTFGAITAQSKMALLSILGVNPQSKVIRFMRILITFNLIAFAWIFFRADNLSDAILITGKIAASVLETFCSPIILIDTLTKLVSISVLECVSIIFMLIFCGLELSKTVQKKYLEPSEGTARWGELMVFDFLLVSLVMLGEIGGSEFLYFNF